MGQKLLLILKGAGRFESRPCCTVVPLSVVIVYGKKNEKSVKNNIMNSDDDLMDLLIKI